MAATVMEGIETQQHPFVSVIDQGHFTSDRLEGAGTKVVKRTAEAMDAMIKTYEEKAAELEHPQQKRMKRAADTGGYMGEVTEKVDPIVSTRSPQALAIVKAKLIVDPEGKDGGGEAGKWIVPPHSLVFALRDREQYVISAVADVQNFYNKSSGEAKYAPIGVSLEDGLDATKFHTEHESRRYFSVAVEGVVSLQCHLEDAKEFNFGDPVYIKTDNEDRADFFQLGFYETTHYRLLKAELGATFRIGYFVEQIDRVRGGIRVKLAIKNQAKDDRLKKRSSKILTEMKEAYMEAENKAVDALFDSTGKPTTTDGSVAKSQIESEIKKVKDVTTDGIELEKRVEAFYENIGIPYNRVIGTREQKAINRAFAQYQLKKAEYDKSPPPASALAAVSTSVTSPSSGPGAVVSASGGAPSPSPGAAVPRERQKEAMDELLKFSVANEEETPFYVIEHFFVEKPTNKTNLQATLKEREIPFTNENTRELEDKLKQDDKAGNRKSFYITKNRKQLFENQMHQIDALISTFKVDEDMTFDTLKGALEGTLRRLKTNVFSTSLNDVPFPGTNKIEKAEWDGKEITIEQVKKVYDEYEKVAKLLIQAAEEGKDLSTARSVFETHSYSTENFDEPYIEIMGALEAAVIGAGGGE